MDAIPMESYTRSEVRWNNQILIRFGTRSHVTRRPLRTYMYVQRPAQPGSDSVSTGDDDAWVLQPAQYYVLKLADNECMVHCARRRPDNAGLENARNDIEWNTLIVCSALHEEDWAGLKRAEVHRWRLKYCSQTTPYNTEQFDSADHLSLSNSFDYA